MRDGYADLWDYTTKFSENDPRIKWDWYSSKEQDGVCMGVLQAKTHAGKEVKLTKFSFFWHKANGLNSLTHTAPDQLASIYDECQHLYEKLLTGNLSGQEILDTIAAIHWWGVQATFCVRGSAAVMEFVVAALALVYGKELQPWKEGVFPDLLALGHHLDEFIRLYPSLREERRKKPRQMESLELKTKD